MDVIYVPKGPAREYAPLAFNLYRGCVHCCGYCYAPGTVHKKRSIFHTDNRPRDQILDRLAVDCKKMAGDPREILLCFTCDPYQEWIDSLNDVTREALLILEEYGMKVTVLTKGGLRAERDFDILERNGWSFGTTLSMVDEKLRKKWEPMAASVTQRVGAIRLAHERGIKTWVSVEPVIHTEQALKAIYRVSPYVDHFKIGAISNHGYIRKRENWPLFLEEVEELLRGHSYYIKNDLWAAAGRKERE